MLILLYETHTHTPLTGCATLHPPLFNRNCVCTSAFQIDRLRAEIERVSHGEPYMGEQIPIKWLKFEQAIVQLADEGTNFATYDQVSTQECRNTEICTYWKWASFSFFVNLNSAFSHSYVR